MEVERRKSRSRLKEVTLSTCTKMNCDVKELMITFTLLESFNHG